MEPNKTLRQIRILTDQIINNPSKNQADTIELARLTKALDRWMTAGGFPPQQWEENRSWSG